MKSKRRLTEAEFAAVLNLLPDLKSDRVEAARLAMVEGKTRQEIADSYAWTHQAVTDSVNVVWRRVEAYRKTQDELAQAKQASIPPGWERAELIAPKAMIRRFRQEIDSLQTPTPATTKRKGTPRK